MRFARTSSLYIGTVQFKGLGVPNKRFATQMVFVQTDTLLAGAMKPLTVLSKFENHFAKKDRKIL